MLDQVDFQPDARRAHDDAAVGAGYLELVQESPSERRHEAERPVGCLERQPAQLSAVERGALECHPSRALGQWPFMSNTVTMKMSVSSMMSPNACTWASTLELARRRVTAS